MFHPGQDFHHLSQNENLKDFGLRCVHYANFERYQNWFERLIQSDKYREINQGTG